MIKETQIEDSLITKLTDLKYTYRADIRDRDTLEKNFREKFQTLNRVNLTMLNLPGYGTRLSILTFLPPQNDFGKSIPLCGRTELLFIILLLT